MQKFAEAASKAVIEAENALRIALDQKEPNYAGFELLLEKIRRASLDFVFLTFATPAAKNAEDRLWDGHVKVNKKFQKHLKQFRDGAGKRKHVERRKAEKHYLHFIKSSMHFYRGYIQRLASHFRKITEISSVADKLHLDTLSVDSPVEVDTTQKNILVTSCHNALMRLGDLSRYRETELEQKDRNWGPAKGHYQLALLLKPESGAAYNQLAVMALADEDHLRAVYYLHRAAAAGKPFPVARDNIKLEFEKLLKFEPEEKPAISDTSKQTTDVLENRLLAFHANCHRQPTEFLTFTEKATQILQLVTLCFEEIQDRSLDRLVQKMCLINIAAEYLAWQGSSMENAQSSKLSVTKPEKRAEEKAREEHDRSCQAIFLLQRFNILTFTALLKVLARELTSDTDGISHQDGDVDELVFVSKPVRRLLPPLRQYSSWLLSNIHALLSPRHPSTQTTCLDQFWKAYIVATNLLLSRYDIAKIEDLSHLLEEDEDTLAFAPFTEKVSKWRYYTEDGMLKPAFPSNPGNERPVEAEMLVRIRRFVFDAATITNQKDALAIDWAPIALLDGEFVSQDKPLKAPEIVKPKTPSQPFRIRAHAQTNSLNGLSPAPSPRPEKQTGNGTVHKQPQAINIVESAINLPDNAAMENMVNDLINHEPVNEATPLARSPLPAPELSPSFNSSSLFIGTERPSSGPLYVTDLVRDMQRRSVEPLSPPALPAQSVNRLSHPSLPGVWNTAFTPRPGETSGPVTQSGITTAPSSMPVQRSSALFQQDLFQQERDIQMRTSPQQSFEISSLPPQHTPPALSSPAWNVNPRSPWDSPSSRSPSQQYKRLPQAALFGAIGEPRRHESRATGSGRSS